MPTRQSPPPPAPPLYATHRNAPCPSVRLPSNALRLCPSASLRKPTWVATPPGQTTSLSPIMSKSNTGRLGPKGTFPPHGRDYRYVIWSDWGERTYPRVRGGSPPNQFLQMGGGGGNPPEVPPPPSPTPPRLLHCQRTTGVVNWAGRIGAPPDKGGVLRFLTQLLLWGGGFPLVHSLLSVKEAIRLICLGGARRHRRRHRRRRREFQRRRPSALSPHPPPPLGRQHCRSP